MRRVESLKENLVPLVVIGVSALMLTACASQANPAATNPSTSMASQPVTGDIPDSTSYTPHFYASGAFMIALPDGWSSTSTSSSVHFTSTVNSVDVKWHNLTSPMSAAAVTNADVVSLKRMLSNIHVGAIEQIALPGGTAIRVDYVTTSAPDPVTGRQYPLTVERFTFVKHSKVVTLSLSSPVGADNVDPWRKISESFAFTSR